MKKLLPGPQVVIPTNTPSTRQGPDSRGFRICVAELGRSCVLDMGFVTFTDGSQYSYDASSRQEFEDLCASVRRGAQFNYQVRRAASGFTRSPVLPPDYETIYTYPPYPGTAPTPCHDWTLGPWDNFNGGNPAFITSNVGPDFTYDLMASTGSPGDHYVEMRAQVDNTGSQDIIITPTHNYSLVSTTIFHVGAQLKIKDLGGTILHSVSVTHPPDPAAGTLTFDYTLAAGASVYVEADVEPNGYDESATGDCHIVIVPF